MALWGVSFEGESSRSDDGRVTAGKRRIIFCSRARVRESLESSTSKWVPWNRYQLMAD